MLAMHLSAKLTGLRHGISRERKKRRKPTISQKQIIIDKQHRLQSRIDNFHQRVYSVVGDIDWNSKKNLAFQADDESEEETGGSFEEDNSEDWVMDDEPDMHWMPSTFGRDFCFKNGWGQFVDQEIQLRVVQAEDSLDELRLAIGLKSLLYRTRIRHSKTQSTKTRSYAELRQVNSKIKEHARRYRCARAALLSLGAPMDTLAKFKELLNTDLRVNTDVVEENRIGQRSDTLPWFWRISTEDVENPFMNESKGCIFMLFNTLI
jgi:hypothetical protein